LSARVGGSPSGAVNVFGGIDDRNDEEMTMPDLHIVPSGDRWDIKEENGDVVSTYDTQAEAEKAGKEWARSHGGGEVFTHRDEGEFSRIRKGDAV
jgi:hypothetical protein